MHKITFISILCLSTSLFSQQTTPNYYHGFDMEDAKIDSTIDESIRKSFEDDDGSLPLKSIVVDLNNDGIPEKLIPNEFMCGSGGCMWYIIEGKTKKLIGSLGAKIFFVNKGKINNYSVIETYWQYGGDEGTVCHYKYSDGKYKRGDNVNLKDEQIQKYFESKRGSKQ